MKLVYELNLDPKAPRPAWMEVGFSFRQPGEDTDPAATPRVTVLDALPRTVLNVQQSQGYCLNQSLMFVPHEDPAACTAFLDAVEPTVDVFGIGSSEVRWRHTATRKAPMRLGSRVAWISLAAPVNTEELAVQVEGRFELRGGAGRPWTGSEPVRFLLPLRPSGTAEPSAEAPRTHRGPGNPKVFVCYAYDNPEHCDLVREFADFLIEQGCDVVLDAHTPPVRRDWDGWSTVGILHSDFTALIASPRMRAVGDGEVGPDENRGLQSELAKLSNLLQRDRPTWTRRILPVILPGYQVADIPLMVHGDIEDHYKVTSFTPEGAKSSSTRCSTNSVASDPWSSRWPHEAVTERLPAPRRRSRSPASGTIIGLMLGCLCSPTAHQWAAASRSPLAAATSPSPSSARAASYRLPQSSARRRESR